MRAAQRRPDDESEAAAVSWSAAPIVTDQAADAVAVFFRDSFAVLVHGKTVRRHLYFNLPAAERVVKNAVARGDRADLVLVRLVPVDARHLGGGA